MRAVGSREWIKTDWRITVDCSYFPDFDRQLDVFEGAPNDEYFLLRSTGKRVWIIWSKVTIGALDIERNPRWLYGVDSEPVASECIVRPHE